MTVCNVRYWNVLNSFTDILSLRFAYVLNSTLCNTIVCYSKPDACEKNMLDLEKSCESC